MSNKKEITSLAIFLNAERTFMAQCSLFSEGPFLKHTPVQASFMAALSLELMLKAALIDEGRQHGGTHQLDKLFKKLSHATQAEIIKIHAELKAMGAFPLEDVWAPEKGPQPPQTVEKMLSQSANAFICLRYIHEGLPENGASWTAHGVLEATREFLIRKHPEWLKISGTTSRPE